MRLTSALSVVLCAGCGGATTPDSNASTRSGRSTVPLAIAAGAEHTCAVRADGVVACWGAGEQGQLGDGTRTDQPIPVVTPGIPDAVELCAGEAYTCARRANRRVACWGSPPVAREPPERSALARALDAPMPVTGLSDAVELAGGGAHACARTRSGQVRCWGDDAMGELGDGTAEHPDGVTTPVPARGVEHAAGIAAGQHHTCAAMTDGGVSCWGANDAAQLAAASDTPAASEPRAVAGVTRAVAIAAGALHTCVLDADRAVRCWGHGDPTATVVRGLRAVVSIAAGREHTCALGADGVARCWGTGAEGQLGDGARADRTAPARVDVGEALRALALGGAHSCARGASGAAWCWGDNAHGQLGDGTTESRAAAVRVGP